jgi:DNA-binding response OmpR family regulator
VILMSARTGQEVSTGLPGVVEVVTKPFDLEYLLELVARLIR